MGLIGRLVHRILGHDWEEVTSGVLDLKSGIALVVRYQCHCGHYGLERNLGPIIDMGPNR